MGRGCLGQEGAATNFSGYFSGDNNKTECILCGSSFTGPTVSPFERIIWLDYYDGPTSGLVKCARGATAYRFELAAWDAHQDNRIFSLAETDSATFDSVVEILRRLDEPSWPVWFPRYHPDSPMEQESVSDLLNRALAKMPPPSLLIVSDRLDKTIVRCRDIDASIRDQLPSEVWSPSDPQKWSYLAGYMGLKEIPDQE